MMTTALGPFTIVSANSTPLKSGVVATCNSIRRGRSAGEKFDRGDAERPDAVRDRVAQRAGDLDHGRELGRDRGGREQQRDARCRDPPRHAADASSSTLTPRMRTDTSDDTPGSCMVTP